MPDEQQTPPVEPNQDTPPTDDATGTNGAGVTPDKTFTQADVDRIISERLTQAQRTAEKNVAKATAEAERKAAEEQGNFKKLYDDTLARLSAAEARQHELELADLRRQAADTVKLPAAFAGRLQGATLEELIEDAKELAAAIPKPTAPNLNNTAGGGGTPGAVPVTDEERTRLASVLGVNPKYLKL